MEHYGGILYSEDEEIKEDITRLLKLNGGFNLYELQSFLRDEWLSKDVERVYRRDFCGGEEKE
jgi:hypothetical protein